MRTQDMGTPVQRTPFATTIGLFITRGLDHEIRDLFTLKSGRFHKSGDNLPV
jgi:hypothetical protein